jgi:hypothetical protein
MYRISRGWDLYLYFCNFFFSYRVSVLVLTYISYMSYHLSRKPISIVKNVLNQNCSDTPTSTTMANVNSTSCGWAPFGKDAILLLTNR